MLHGHVLSQAKQLNNNFLQSGNMVHPEGKVQGSRGASIIRETYCTTVRLVPGSNLSAKGAFQDSLHCLLCLLLQL